MTYEQNALKALAAVRTFVADPCDDCGGGTVHDPNCPTLRPELLEKATAPGAPTLGEPLTLEQVKALHVARVLREKKWNRTHAARALAIDRRTLHVMIVRYGLKEST